jgi:hypothetical protein
LTPFVAVHRVEQVLDEIYAHLGRLLEHGVPAKRTVDKLTKLGGTPRKPGVSGLQPGQVPPWVDPFNGLGNAGSLGNVPPPPSGEGDGNG